MNIKSVGIEHLELILRSADMSELSKEALENLFQEMEHKRFHPVSYHSNVLKYRTLLFNYKNLLPHVKEKFTASVVVYARTRPAEIYPSASTEAETMEADLTNDKDLEKGDSEDANAAPPLEPKDPFTFAYVHEEDFIDRFLTVVAGIVSLFWEW